jgi:class 3 adenylate cyclase
MGDGVLAYFGYPLAHDDDAERAVGAALKVIDNVSALQTSERLQLRVGLGTGVVVVGEVVGSGRPVKLVWLERHPTWRPACRAWRYPTPL